MKAKILSSIPISGSIREKHFNANGECSWVKFETDNTPWVGVFGRGISPSVNAVSQFFESGRFFVLAGGQGYIVDAGLETCVHKTKDDYYQSLVSVPDRCLMIVCDYSHIEFYDSEKLVWQSDRVALDGIRLNSADRQNVYGHLWQIEGWYSFKLNLDTREFAQSNFVSPDWDHFK